MKLIYQNFDGLDMSFQGALPDAILDELREAKEEAQRRHADVPTKLGPRQHRAMVAETGVRGGYAYRFDTGPAGAVWMVAHSDDPERWNIRVSVKSLALAQHGYHQVRDQLSGFLADLGAFGPGLAEDGTRQPPQESISRLDYCLDFATAGFQPDPARFIAHPRCGRRVHGKLGLDESFPDETVYRGRRIESVRIGEMPGRQIALYDKTREIGPHDKPYWWDLWGLDRSEFDAQVWLVEARAGKAELDTWNLRSFADFEHRAGDVVKGTLQAIRYVTPTADSNAARWPLHPLWADSLTAAGEALAPYVSRAERRKIMDDLRANVTNRVRNLFPGLFASYTSLLGLDISELPTTLETVAEDVVGFAAQNPEAITRKFLNAEERYLFLQ